MLILSLSGFGLSIISGFGGIGFLYYYFKERDNPLLLGGIFLLIMSVIFYMMGSGSWGDIIVKETYDKPVIEKIELRNGKANIYATGFDVVIKDEIICLDEKNIWIKNIYKEDPENNYSLLVCEENVIRSEGE